MTTPTYFTVVADYKSVVVDLASDVDADPQLGPVTGKVTFTPILRSGDVILATDASPRPTGFVAAPIVARIDTDGRLKLRVEPDGDRDDFANLAAFPATGNTAKVYFAINTQTFYRWNGSTYVETYPYAPVRLLADTALLELDSELYYRVSFSDVVFNGGPGYIAPFTFQAPNTDTELNLIEVMRQPGQPASGITKIAPGAVRVVEGNLLQFSFGGVDIPDPVDVNITTSVIEDSGATGRALIQSETTGAARTAINAASRSIAINVLDYISDPADTSTHQAGFQAAINAAIAGAGTEIVIPGGTWHVENLSIPQRTPLKIRGHCKSNMPIPVFGEYPQTEPTVLLRTGNNPVFRLIGAESDLDPDYPAGYAPGTDAAYVHNWPYFVHDFALQDVSIRNGNPSATTPLIEMKGVLFSHFTRVHLYAPGSGFSLLTMQAVWDTKFIDCMFAGGGGVGIPQVLIQGSNGTTYTACTELQFLNTIHDNYFGPALQIGDDSSQYLSPAILLFANHKMESKQTAEPHVLIGHGNHLMFKNFYASSAFTTGAVVDVKKCFGLYGDMGFLHISVAGSTEPSSRVKLSANTNLVNLDVNLWNASAESNAVDVVNESDRRTVVRVNGNTTKVNGDTKRFGYNEVGTMFQAVSATTFNCQYIFNKSGLNQWSVGNPANPTGDQQQFTISASDGTNEQTMLRLRSYSHVSGRNPVTATYRDVTPFGFVNLLADDHGWVNFRTQLADPVSPVGGLQLYAKNNGGGGSRSQLTVYADSGAHLVETRGIATTASAASLTINSNRVNHQTVSALASALTINAPTGTPTSGQRLTVAIKDNGTARALTWNAAWSPVGVALPSTTVIGQWLVVTAEWSASASAWLVMRVQGGPAKTIDGVAFDGTADVTVIAPATNAATSKTTPVDADAVPLVDSAASNTLKRLTWANIKATMKSYYDSVTATLTGKSIDLGSNTITGTISQFNTALSDADFATLAGTETLSGKSMSGSTNTFTNIPQSAVTSLTTDLGNKVNTTAVGAANGVASLDSGGKVPAGQLPNSVMEYQGTWNATANTPTLADGIGSAGDVYRVSTGGTRNLGSGTISFTIGDYVIYNGTVWEKSDTTDAVDTVNGYTGTVSLTQDDVPSGTTNKVFTGTEQTKLAGIATGATANSSDATLLDRANHTGTQAASTISDFASAADARISAAVGVSLQGYDADLAAFAAKSAPTGDVVGTSDVQALTNKDLSGTGNTFPTLNQNTTGSAATLTTSRTVRTDLASTSTASFNGSADITPGVTGTLPVGNGGTGATTLTGLVKGSGTSALAAATAGTDYTDTTDVVHDLASGQATLSRRMVNNTTIQCATQQLRLTMFTARKAETIADFRTLCTTAATSTTLARIGLYTVDNADDLTLVASTTTDTALWSATGRITKSLSTPYTLTRGQRYAVGVLWVGSGTAPQFMGIGTIHTQLNDEMMVAPRMCGQRSGQSDLPNTVAAVDMTVSQNLYVALVP